MTIAQQFEQKGIEKGRAEGLQLGEHRGIEKGRNEGKLEVARTMLENGIDRNTVMKMTGLTEKICGASPTEMTGLTSSLLVNPHWWSSVSSDRRC